MMKAKLIYAVKMMDGMYQWEILLQDRVTICMENNNYKTSENAKKAAYKWAKKNGVEICTD